MFHGSSSPRRAGGGTNGVGKGDSGGGECGGVCDECEIGGESGGCGWGVSGGGESCGGEAWGGGGVRLRGGKCVCVWGGGVWHG